MSKFVGWVIFGAFLWWIVPQVNDAIFPPKVDAFYYPNRGNLLIHETVFGLKNVEECRSAVFRMAAAKGDPNLSRGDYECGVGYIKDAYGVRVYNDTVK